jgi:hypothetical protein
VRKWQKGAAPKAASTFASGAPSYHALKQRPCRINFSCLSPRGLRLAKVQESDTGRVMFFKDLAWAFDPGCNRIYRHADLFTTTVASVCPHFWS